MLEYQLAYFEKRISPGRRPKTNIFLKLALEAEEFLNVFITSLKNASLTISCRGWWKLKKIFYESPVSKSRYSLHIVTSDFSRLWFIYSIFIVFSIPILEKNLWLRRQREIVLFFLEIILTFNDYLKNLLKDQYSYLMISFVQYLANT